MDILEKEMAGNHEKHMVVVVLDALVAEILVMVDTFATENVVQMDLTPMLLLAPLATAPAAIL